VVLCFVTGFFLLGGFGVVVRLVVVVVNVEVSVVRVTVVEVDSVSLSLADVVSTVIRISVFSNELLK
jgi:hypothetical protein